MMVRLNELENFVMKEVPRVDNSIMMGADMAGLREQVKEVRRQQEVQMVEINTLKAIAR